MTTEHHLPRRRAYLIGRARPLAIVGRNRENGELLVLLVGGSLGLLTGLLVPYLWLRAAGLIGFPLIAFAIVYAPFRGRTVYRWFEINRTYRRMTRSGRGRWRSGAMEAGTSTDGGAGEDGARRGDGRSGVVRARVGQDEVGE